MSSGRPVVFFDVETTGLSRAEDRIVEIFMTKRDPRDGSKLAEDLYFVLDPQRPMGKEALALHGISDDAVKGKPKFGDVADHILDYIKGCDLSGYNIIGFDLQFMFEEFMKCGRMFRYMDHRIVDSYVLWTKMEPRTLIGATRRFLREELVDAHQAKADTEVQVRVLLAQMAEYGVGMEDVARVTDSSKMLDLAGKFARGTVSPEHPSDGPVYNFGKYKGLGVFDVHKKDPGYLAWLANSETMGSDTRMFARKFLQVAREKVG